MKTLCKEFTLINVIGREKEKEPEVNPAIHFESAE